MKTVSVGWLILVVAVGLITATIHDQPQSITLKGAFSEQGVPLLILKSNPNTVFTANYNTDTQTLTVYAVNISDTTGVMNVSDHKNLPLSGCPNPVFIDVFFRSSTFWIQCPGAIYALSYQNSLFGSVSIVNGVKGFVYLGTDYTSNQVNFMGPSTKYPGVYELKTILQGGSSINVYSGPLLPLFSVGSPNNVLSALSFYRLDLIELSLQLVDYQYATGKLDTQNGLFYPESSNTGVADFFYYFPIEVEGITAIKLRNSVNKTILGLQRFNVRNGRDEGSMYAVKGLQQLSNHRFVQSALSLPDSNGAYSLFMTVQNSTSGQVGVSQVLFNNVGASISHNEVYHPGVLGPVVANSKYVVFWSSRITLTSLPFSNN